MLKEEILKTWLNVSFTCSEVINRQENNSHLSLRASVLKLNTQQKSAVTRLLWLDPVALTEPQMDLGWLNWSLVKVLHFVHHLPPCDSDGNINAAQVSQVGSGCWSGGAAWLQSELAGGNLMTAAETSAATLHLTHLSLAVWPIISSVTLILSFLRSPLLPPSFLPSILTNCTLSRYYIWDAAIQRNTHISTMTQKYI